jgi:hypothetical protein
MKQAPTYEIRKNRQLGHWNLTVINPGWITPLGKFAKRKEAIIHARLLAGRRGRVVVA